MFRKSRFNPTPGIIDFWTEFKKPTPYRLPILLASTAPVLLLLWWATFEEYDRAPERPSVTYITTYAADQSEAEIIAKSKARQAIIDQRKAEREAAAARKREFYRELGRATGVDVPDEPVAETGDGTVAETTPEPAS